MKNEFMNRFMKLDLKFQYLDKIGEIIKESGDEFPCLTCPSTEDCATFAWFLKWFGNKDKK